MLIQLENVSFSSVSHPKLKLNHLIFSLVSNPKLKSNHLILTSMQAICLLSLTKLTSIIGKVTVHYQLKKKSEEQYYRDNKNLPLYGTKNPDTEEIFRICLLQDIPEEKCIKEKPFRIKHTSTFVIKQDLISLKHPYDLEADDTPGVLKKHNKVRFYEAKQMKEAELVLSSEVHMTKDRNGHVTGGTYNYRTN